MRFTAHDLAAAVGGALHGDPDATADGVVIDSRVVRGGELFVPIVAERDGHDYLPSAIAAGASVVLTQARVPDPLPDGTTAIAVADTAAALLDVGRLARKRLGTLVVGITGSVGKTSTKDLLAATLARRWRTSASEKSFNNELGVPLTLANAPDGTQACVVEMGARGRGHVALLCEVARPTVGVVTAVVHAHTEMFGHIDEVAAAKGELVESLPAAGTAVLNADDARVAAMADRTEARVLLYSVNDEPGADVVADGLRLDDHLRGRFTLRSPFGSADVALEVRGEHQVANALAAASAAMACGVSVEEVAAGLAEAALSPWRMDLRRTPAGALVLNDAYNANPASMEAALRSLAAVPAHRRVAVLGLMAELGEHHEREHEAVLDLAADLGIDVIAFETDAYGEAAVLGVEGALVALGRLGEGDAVLVKGSRVAGLERVAAALLAE
jgi:UDP-N-acetylmuramoyl-tripeptide--D-alanyl-D-alanine ligase